MKGGWLPSTTPLLYAASIGKADIVALLLARKAALPIATPNGRMLLQLAVQNGLTDLLSLLIAKGDDVRAVEFTIMTDSSGGCATEGNPLSYPHNAHAFRQRDQASY